MSKIFCSNCGREIEADAKYCDYCGVKNTHTAGAADNNGSAAPEYSGIGSTADAKPAASSRKKWLWIGIAAALTAVIVIVILVTGGAGMEFGRVPQVTVGFTNTECETTYDKGSGKYTFVMSICFDAQGNAVSPDDKGSIDTTMPLCTFAVNRSDLRKAMDKGMCETREGFVLKPVSDTQVQMTLYGVGSMQDDLFIIERVVDESDVRANKGDTESVPLATVTFTAVTD